MRKQMSFDAKSLFSAGKAELRELPIAILPSSV